jgi:hypothetical protein
MSSRSTEIKSNSGIFQQTQPKSQEQKIPTDPATEITSTAQRNPPKSPKQKLCADPATEITSNSVQQTAPKSPEQKLSSDVGIVTTTFESQYRQQCESPPKSPSKPIRPIQTAAQRSAELAARREKQRNDLQQKRPFSEISQSPQPSRTAAASQLVEQHGSPTDHPRKQSIDEQLTVLQQLYILDASAQNEAPQPQARTNAKW